jgi:formate-dependent phosphoribosylglycinamide formyltransferase (GAR transformylase)
MKKILLLGSGELGKEFVISAKRLGCHVIACDSYFSYADSAAELLARATDIGFPVVIKPVMSSSGKGQSVAQTAADIQASWDYACAGMRGDRQKVIVEEFIHFEFEITLLTVRQRKARRCFAHQLVMSRSAVTTNTVGSRRA